jgi:catechol 2,3-dioxygenase-like lactoylglutathione lyase family enzyme
MLERYSFVAITTRDLAAARHFWAEQLGFLVVEERRDDYFIVDAGGLRLAVDLADGENHKTGSTDPVIGFKVSSVAEVLEDLRERGWYEDLVHKVADTHAILHDPDGRAVVMTERDRPLSPT